MTIGNGAEVCECPAPANPRPVWGYQGSDHARSCGIIDGVNRTDRL